MEQAAFTAPPVAPHCPVLLAEVLGWLAPGPGKAFVDCTLGAGGHSSALWQAIQPGGHLIAVDQDAGVLEETQIRLTEENLLTRGVTWISANFSELPAKAAPLLPLSGGLLADLGVSSMQLDRPERGFSFRADAPLDMRMNPDAGPTAADVVNSYKEAELVRIFSEYGEERFSKTIAREVVAARKSTPFQSTQQLAQFIEAIYKRMPGGKPGGNAGNKKGPKDKFRIHPATRVFQALRIEVNQELEHLETLLNCLPQLMAPGARAAIISFHSLEDRIVKRAFRAMSRSNDSPATLKVLTPKPIEASEAEIRQNPRARSAKLRVAERIDALSEIR